MPIGINIGKSENLRMTQYFGHRGTLAGARILVVEDEFIIGMQLQSLFEDEGAQVVGPCHTLSEAVEHAEHDDLSAASLDLNLGRETALPVAAVLQQRRIPFLFYSVQTVDPALIPWRHIRLIQKPADARLLISGMAGILHRQKTEAAE